jgi:exosortase family protein XrtF
VTNLVARQCEELIDFAGFQAQVRPHPDEPSMKLIINDTYVARIIEGCNAISVIILFVSFVAAFSGKPKVTFMYMLSGSVLLYAVNLIRIVVLSIAVYVYPERSEILHSVVFPAIIYGMVFLLWVFWVNRFSNMIKKNER